MWWPRRRRPEPEQPAEPGMSPEAREQLAAAKRAREQAEQRLEKVRRRQPEVEEIADSLRRVRARNGFAELFAAALRGHDGDPSAG
jgi:DNA repair exonuclease SbcCD ATPase subunit